MSIYSEDTYEHNKGALALKKKEQEKLMEMSQSNLGDNPQYSMLI